MPAFDDSVLKNVPDSDVDDLLNNVDNESVLNKLEQSVNMLTSEEKAIITLYYQKELPVKEIAEITGLTEANVKIKLHRVRKKLYVMVTN